MSLPIGARLGPYEITAALGAGGMGEVYRARDTRLGRSVALKILSAGIVGDPDRRMRFEREARAIASLNHPHICTLHDVGRERPSSGAEEVQFLVMELIDGETLAARLARGPLQRTEVLSYAVQIADALDRAHDEGIVHRDLKPANIMLAQSGAPHRGSAQVKLLDFGVARLRSDSVLAPDGQTSSVQVTAPGVVFGTPQYMAPEQLEGKPADARADVFAFGAIVYEMAAGRRAFEASSGAGLIAAILKSEPPPLDPSCAPPALARIISTCLDKDPDHRWSTAHDVLLALRGIEEDPTSAVQRASAGRRREGLAWGVAAAAAVVAALLAFQARIGPAMAPVDALSIVPPVGTTLVAGEAAQISPDGRQIAFVASDASGRSLLYVRPRDSTAAHPLPETDDATHHFWSPDSRSLGFFSRGSLRTIAIAGGPPQAIAPASVSRGGSWSRDNKILFLRWPGAPMSLVSASGGPISDVPANKTIIERRWFPSFLPDGRHYVFVGWETRHVEPSIKLGSLDSTDIKDLVKSRTSAAYVDAGYLLFSREGSLMAQPFDIRRLELTGEGVRVAENVGFNAITYQGYFSASNDGAVAYLGGDPAWDLVWFDRSGRRLERAGPPARYNSLCLSADGRRIVYDSGDASGNVDLWEVDVAGGEPRRLTFGPTVDFYPVCSPTGSEVMFASARSGVPNIYRVTTTAPGTETQLTNSAGAKALTDWSRDGRFVVYSQLTPDSSWDIWVLPTDGGKPVPFLQTEAEEREGRLSPDGRWMAYASNQGSGRLEIYVERFPRGTSSARWQITTTGGRQPMWSPDGHQLFYLTPDDRLSGVDVNPGQATFGFFNAHPILDVRIAGWERANPGRPYAITPDGQRFLVSVASSAPTPITLLLNWRNR